MAVEGWADRARRIVFRPGERRERAYARSPRSLTAAVIHSSVVSLSCLPFRLGALVHTRLNPARRTHSPLHHLHHLHRSRRSGPGPDGPAEGGHHRWTPAESVRPEAPAAPRPAPPGSPRSPPPRCSPPSCRPLRRRPRRCPVST
ncbi:hypothetical protein BN2537_12679 [Streptomyces venezuelae]|nr:hypothetical protein BN2537_12679 [Streptomyces venezuelae]